MKSKLTLVFFSLVITLGGLLSPLSVGATMLDDASIIDTQVDTVLHSARLKDELNEKLKKMAIGSSYNSLVNGEIKDGEQINDSTSEPWDVSDDPRVFVNDDLKILDGGTIAANTTTFTNNTKEDTTFKTAAFDYKRNMTIETSTSHSLNLGVTTTAEMKFPIAGGSVSMETKYGFTTGSKNTTTEEYVWKVPSQDIPVKAGKKVRVTWFLSLGKAEGTVKLQDKISAMIPFKKEGNNRLGRGLGQVASDRGIFSDEYWNLFMKEDRANWAYVDEKSALYNVGVASYSANYGTELNVISKDITDGEENAPVIATYPVNAVVEKAQ